VRSLPCLLSLLLLLTPLHAVDAKTLTLASVDQRTVTVDASAVAKAMPDKIEWHLQIKSVQPTVKQSRADVDAALQRLLAALKNAGIPEKTLVVSDVEQGREREMTDRQWIFKGFFSISTIRLSLTNFRLVDRVQSEILADDLITVQSMEQVTEHKGELRQQALADAAGVARKKAEILATSLGAKVGDVLQIVETSGEGNGLVTEQFLRDTSAGKSEGLVSEITVRAAISVTFELVK
jgi:hypothetical protein